MMNQEDKRFFIKAITQAVTQSEKRTGARFDGLEIRMDSLDGRMDSLDGRMDSLDGRMDSLDGRMDSLDGRMDSLDGRMDSLDTKIDGVDTRLSTELRHQGVILEQVQHSVDWLVESNKTLHERVGRLENDVAEIKENISDLPVIRATVKKHSRELAALRQ